MLKRIPKQPQLEMFKTVLTSFINPNHELCHLAKKIEWDTLETEFTPLYGTTGRPSVPIRKIVGLLLLKQMYNLGDETVVERYLENPYWQHFCGEIYFQYRLPFDPSDFVHFRHRVGSEGMEKIFQQSISIFGKEVIQEETKEVRIDTTVQEKNITFPTDRKLLEKCIQHCKRIAKEKGIKLKRTYAKELKRLFYQMRFQRSKSNAKILKKNKLKLHKIAIKIYNDLVSQFPKMTPQEVEKMNNLFFVLSQKRSDKKKIYSIHEPDVECIAKGKEHKPYEFGNKSSFAYTRKSGIIVGALAFQGNPYDGHTLEPQLNQIQLLTQSIVEKSIVDRGYKGASFIGGTEIILPDPNKNESPEKKKERKESCQSRAGIEGLISHLKHQHRLIRNYLKGVAGDKINTLMAAAAYNMLKWLRKVKGKLLNVYFLTCFYLHFIYYRNMRAIAA